MKKVTLAGFFAFFLAIPAFFALPAWAQGGACDPANCPRNNGGACPVHGQGAGQGMGRQERFRGGMGDDASLESANAYGAETAEGEPVLKVGTTLENLQAAYNGESNANAMYLAFAAKADEEGYGRVASLFRAAATAERIHAGNHADVIRRLGAEPVAEIKPVEPKTTRENLLAGVKGETYERLKMYPAFMRKARADRMRDAMRTFNYALTAEAGHAELYAEAEEQLVKMKGLDGETYYVCPTCGYTVKESDYLTFKKCPVCFTGADTFLSVE